MPWPSRDLLVAGLAALVVQLDLWLLEGLGGEPAVTVVSAVAFSASLAWRTCAPLVMVAIASFALVAGAAGGGQLTETLTVAAVAMLVVFSAAAHLALRPSLAALAAFLAASWADAVIAHESQYSLLSDIAFTTLIVIAGPHLAGRALRDRREHAEQLERMTRRLAEQQELRAELAVTAERSRIAREMHDVVAHSVSLMVVQTGAARALLDDDPEQTRSALLAAEQAGREALAELRRALGVMRGNENGAGTEEADLTPQPGLGDLDTLVARARQAGLDVSVAVRGRPRPLPGGADLAAYRVVQEALTNAIKHAAAPSASVLVEWRRDDLALAITDTGRGPNGEPSPDSFGLVGMRERIALYGGSVETGAADGGGFAVRARIPLAS